MSGRLLMVTAVTLRDVGDGDGYCVAIRFCKPGDVAHMEDLMIKQVRSRYARFEGMKPAQVRAGLRFIVWEVPQDEPTHGGWPKVLGESTWFK